MNCSLSIGSVQPLQIFTKHVCSLSRNIITQASRLTAKNLSMNKFPVMIARRMVCACFTGVTLYVATMTMVPWHQCTYWNNGKPAHDSWRHALETPPHLWSFMKQLHKPWVDFPKRGVCNAETVKCNCCCSRQAVIFAVVLSKASPFINICTWLYKKVK